MVRGMGNINLIIKKRLCSGCGACTVICKRSCISMKKDKDYNYPSINAGLCNHCGLCLQVCPGKGILDRLSAKSLWTVNLQNTLAHYVAWSTDDTIRYNAASGGVITSLIFFLIKEKSIDGAICVKQEEKMPLYNKSFVAASETEVLQASGSRYSPVSNCEVLKEILQSNKKYAFIGKPCEVDAIIELQKYMPELREQIRLTISLMCACTPSRKGTLKLLQKLHLEPSKITTLSYRGKGWPGCFRVETKEGGYFEIPYFKAWNHYLSKYSCLRCRLCDDPLGREADLTVGDAWDQKLLQNNTGLSAVVVRTERGRQYMDRGIENNVVSVNKVTAEDIFTFQKSLISKRKDDIYNTFAYHFVFLHRLNLKEVYKVFGNSVKSYYCLFKTFIRFLILKYQ